MGKLIKIKKIHVSARPVVVQIEYSELNRMGRWDDKRLKSTDEPLPELVVAMQNMVPHFIENCELPEELEIDAVVKSLTIGWNNPMQVETLTDLDEAMQDLGVVITGHRKMKLSNTPFNFSSPYKMAINENNEDQQLSISCVHDLQKVIKHGMDYLAGRRSQQDLFAAADEEAEKAKEPKETRTAQEIADTIESEIASGKLTVESARDLLKQAKQIREVCEKEGATITVASNGSVSLKKRGTRKATSNVIKLKDVL